MVGFEVGATEGAPLGPTASAVAPSAASSSSPSSSASVMGMRTVSSPSVWAVLAA